MNWEEDFDKRFVVKSAADTDLLRFTDASLIKAFIRSLLAAQKQELKREVEGIRKECPNHSEPGVECYGYDEEFNSALDAVLKKLDEKKTSA